MKKELRIIFIGTPDFAVESLNALCEAGKNIVAVITAPDRKAGRGQKVNESAVKKYALQKGIDILQPVNLKNEEFVTTLKEYKADLQIVVAFRMLPEIVWNMPLHGTFNLHASLLPDYRGAAPINWAIINGEKETGVSTFFLKHKIDTGDIIDQEKVTIEADETAGSLHDKLMEVGGKLVVKTVNSIEDNSYQLLTQEKREGKEAPKIFKNDTKIDWQKSAEKVDRLIRGMSPYPSAWCKLENKETQKELNFKIYKISVLAETNLQMGELKVEAKRIFAGTATQNLELLEIQVEGKKRMNAKELLNGFELSSYKLV